MERVERRRAHSRDDARRPQRFADSAAASVQMNAPRTGARVGRAATREPQPLPPLPPPLPVPHQAPRDPAAWDVFEVCEWLEYAGLGHLLPLWQMCGMDGMLTLTLSRAQLLGDLGMTPQDASEFLQAMSALQAATSPRGVRAGSSGRAASRSLEPARSTTTTTVALAAAAAGHRYLRAQTGGGGAGGASYDPRDAALTAALTTSAASTDGRRAQSARVGPPSAPRRPATHGRQPFAELPPEAKPRLPAAAAALVRRRMQADASPGHMRRYLRHAKPMRAPASNGGDAATRAKEKAWSVRDGAAEAEAEAKRRARVTVNSLNEDTRGNTPLHWACCAGDVGAMREALAADRDEGEGRMVRARNQGGETALHKAVSAGDAYGSTQRWLDAVQLLLTAGVDVNQQV